MKTKSQPVASIASVQPAFWDTSAVIPLCALQPQSRRARQTARHYPKQVVWWLTSVEAYSSLSRLAREGYLSAKESLLAFKALHTLRRRWHEIQPIDEVRDVAERVLRTHKLRAADALQLASALIWCGNRPRSRVFVCADLGLSQAAEVEGFSAIHLA
ncbi:MAG TPA: type II toxin-antitoxin system VapC family toxin [Blastocatellia bacterium]|nr:type II toxin-antitoxin system VapC family toxin [Blastocatellia bacterium]